MKRLTSEYGSRRKKEDELCRNKMYKDPTKPNNSVKSQADFTKNFGYGGSRSESQTNHAMLAARHKRIPVTLPQFKFKDDE